MAGRVLRVACGILPGLLTLILFAGCATTTSPRDPSSGIQSTGERKVVRNEPQLKVRTIQKWNPIWWFGNVDEPEPPDWYKPGDASRRRKWLMRNPLHNFTFYVIGMADKPFVRTGKHPKDVFSPHGGWNLAVCRHRFRCLPFVSYTRGRFATYFGWRERGNFGIKLTFREQVKPAAPVEKPELELDTESSSGLP